MVELAAEELRLAERAREDDRALVDRETLVGERVQVDRGAPRRASGRRPRRASRACACARRVGLPGRGWRYGTRTAVRRLRPRPSSATVDPRSIASVRGAETDRALARSRRSPVPTTSKTEGRTASVVDERHPAAARTASCIATRAARVLRLDLPASPERIAPSRVPRRRRGELGAAASPTTRTSPGHGRRSPTSSPTRAEAVTSTSRATSRRASHSSVRRMAPETSSACKR